MAAPPLVYFENLAPVGLEVGESGEVTAHPPAHEKVVVCIQLPPRPDRVLFHRSYTRTSASMTLLCCKTLGS